MYIYIHSTTKGVYIHLKIGLLISTSVGVNARLKSHYKAWSYKKKKHKQIKAYWKSLYKEPALSRCLLILDLKPFRL